ncbi:hypothetical protein ACFQY5_27430 [Paeniroseomonas aquatica]|uniref:hypothetical protein n=1 Tax=Paeniroseomonas aquatica TaxID=373043 RepID=UPI0036109BAA
MSITETRVPAPEAARLRARASRASAVAICWPRSPERSAMVVWSATGIAGSTTARTSPRRTAWPSRGRPASGSAMRPPARLWATPPRLGSATMRPTMVTVRDAAASRSVMVRTSSRRWLTLGRKTRPSGRRAGASTAALPAGGAASSWSCPSPARAGRVGSRARRTRVAARAARRGRRRRPARPSPARPSPAARPSRAPPPATSQGWCASHSRAACQRSSKGPACGSGAGSAGSVPASRSSPSGPPVTEKTRSKGRPVRASRGESSR